MRKILYGALALLITALTDCNGYPQSAVTDNRPVIKIGSDNYPPYNYLDENGVPTGIDVELATEAFDRIGYNIEVITIDWEKKKELVENGEIDCIIGCFSMEGRLEDGAVLAKKKELG